MAWPSRGSGLVVAQRTRGECPSVHAPFRELDGALMRVRLPGGVFPVAGARALADGSARVGAGPLELTNRGNLQVRAVPDEASTALRDQLVEAGLVRADAATDERRNVMASPTAGVDETELLDTSALVAAIAEHLAEHGADLSPKFGVLVDGGGAVHVRGRAHDLAFGAVARSDGSVGFEVRLGAPLPLSWGIDASLPVVAPGDVLAVVDAVLDVCRPFGRIATYVDAVGVAEAWSEIEHRAPGAVDRWATAELSAPAGVSESIVGLRRQRDPALATVGAAAVLGRLMPDTLAQLADLADGLGLPALRISPWRSIALVDVPREAAAEVVVACERAGLVCDPDHPVNLVVACAGTTGCAEARADVQSDARALIARLEDVPRERRPASVHVSGCSKGCARADAADRSLVADASGTYELYCRTEHDEHLGTPRFGQRIAVRLTPGDAVDAVVSGVGDDH